MGLSTFERIYDVVRSIPMGKVMTYGQVALLAGNPRWARVVGYALHELQRLLLSRLLGLCVWQRGRFCAVGDGLLARTRSHEQHSHGYRGVS